MSLPLANVTRTTLSLARKSAFLAANAQHSRTITNNGPGPSVSLMSSATFLGASLAAKKLGTAEAEKKSVRDGEAAEVHEFLKAAIQNKQKSMEAEKAAKEAKEVCIYPHLFGTGGCSPAVKTACPRVLISWVHIRIQPTPRLTRCQ